MISTLRPKSPPLALTSSAQICAVTRYCLATPALPPVSDRPKPILIGSCAWAATAHAAVAAAMAMAMALFMGPSRFYCRDYGTSAARLTSSGHPVAQEQDACRAIAALVDEREAGGRDEPGAR